MSFVAIVGAGALGGALAHKLAGRDRVGEIRLIDPASGIAAGTALDVQQAGPVESFRTTITACGDISAVAGAAAIVLADAAGPTPGEWTGEPGLALLRRLSQLEDRAVFVFAGASQRRLVELGARELKIPRVRLVGSAPGALAAALSALVALESGGSALDVSLSVLGAPPDRTVVAWSEATIAGHALARTLQPPQLVRLTARIPRLWPPGPYALAAAAARVTEAVVVGSRRQFCCFAVLDAQFGAEIRVVAMPVAIGPRGIERLVVPPLSVRERVQLENAIANS